MGISAIDATGSGITLKSSLDSGEHVKHVIVDDVAGTVAVDPVQLAAGASSGALVVGTFLLGNAIPTGGNVIGLVGINGPMPALTAGSAIIGATYAQPRAAGVLTEHRHASAGSTNSTNVKASAGAVSRLIATNTSATLHYVKLYDKATAPTVGTDTPKLTIAVPARSTVQCHLEHGLGFANGIGFGITALGTDADTTAIAANDSLLHLSYL